VRIGGVDVKDLSDEDRAAQLSLVFQDVYLFNESLRENIALGDPDASESEVLHAAELAQVTPIAERIPGGWDGSVGEGGKLLSGGERQRVSIARALLKKGADSLA
jgi:ATP-binding cassette subfamily B protein